MSWRVTIFINIFSDGLSVFFCVCVDVSEATITLARQKYFFVILLPSNHHKSKPWSMKPDILLKSGCYKVDWSMSTKQACIIISVLLEFHFLEQKLSIYFSVFKHWSFNEKFHLLKMWHFESEEEEKVGYFFKSFLPACFSKNWIMHFLSHECMHAYLYMLVSSLLPKEILLMWH